MSKQKQKGKKDELEGFDLKKEKELLKKLAQKEQEEGEEEGQEEEIPAAKPKKQNLFSNDLFQQAQVIEAKKNKKKKNKPEKNQQNQENNEGQDSEEEEILPQEIAEEIMEEILERRDIHEINQEFGGELDIQVTKQRKKPENNKQKPAQGQKEQKEKAMEQIKEHFEKQIKQEKGQAKDKEKSGRFWNIFISVFLALFMCLLLFSKYNEEKFRKIARFNQGEGLQEDLYEILEVDSSASPQDIKKQFKKLAVAWHPDKNPGCGQPCNEKFDKIHKAYEVLSDPEKKKNYDENSGVFSPIKSKTVSLTVHNYKRLVEESNDIWIIQVYEDGNPTCIHIADTWDMVAKSYSGSIKFGRINAMSQNELLKRLPYHITIFPTIMAVVPGEYPDIFTWSRYNLDLALKKFIEGNIINFVIPITEKTYLATWGEKNQNLYSSTQRKHEVIYITNGDTTPIFYKYAAFQLHDLFDFYQNTFGEANKIRKALEKSKLDFVVKVDHLKDENKEDRYSRSSYNFVANEGSIANQFNKISEFVKFNTVPELDKYLYAEFCGGNEGSSMGSTQEDFDDELKPSVCILLLKNSTAEAAHQKNTYEIQKYQKVKSQKLYLHIMNNEPLFENYHRVRFGAIDLNRQPKFKRIIEEFGQKNEHSTPAALAFIHENGKYFIWDQSYDLVDFLERLENNDDNLDAYYANEILGTSHLGEYLFSKNENVFTFFYKTFKQTLGDFKILTALAVVILMNSFVLKKTFGASVVNGAMLYLVLSVVLSVFATYQELF